MRTNFYGMTVEAVKAINGTTVYEVQHNGQTLSDVYATAKEAEYCRARYADLKNTPNDPLGHYWKGR